MDSITLLNVETVNVSSPSWEQRFQSLMQKKRNFVFVDSNEAELRRHFVEQSRQSDYCPDFLHRWGIYALNDVMDSNDQLDLLEDDRQGQAIALVEQLLLPTVRPPFVARFIIYCQVRGIISEHDELDGAKQTLQAFIEAYHRAKHFPLAGIHQWEGNRWEKLRYM